MLFLPLLVLAIPIVDTTFVVARRLKHGQQVSEADQAHLHYPLPRRGFSQRRAALTMWAWCVTLATAALATRFIPFREGGEWHLWPTLAAGAIGLVALAVLGVRRLRARDRQAHEPARSAGARRPPAASASPPSGAREERRQRLVERPRSAQGPSGRRPGARPAARRGAARARRRPRRTPAWWPPETTSFGNGAAASSPAGSRPRAGSARPSAPARLPRSRAGAATRRFRRRADEREERTRGTPRGSVGTSPAARSARGTPRPPGARARRRSAGGSTTVSEASGAARGREERDDAAVGVAARWSPGSSSAASSLRLLLEVDPLERRVGGKPDG